MYKIKEKKNKLVFALFLTIFIMLLAGCSGSKNYSEKEVKSYLNKVYGKDMYTMNNKTQEDDQTDLYTISCDDVTFTVKSYVKDDKKCLEDQYCKAKSVKYFKEHDYTEIAAKYLEKNINIEFYSPTDPRGIIIGTITINKETDPDELADLIVQIDSELALRYDEAESIKYDFTNSPGAIGVTKNVTVGISEYDLWEKTTSVHYSYSDETRLTKQQVLDQLEKDLGNNE